MTKGMYGFNQGKGGDPLQGRNLLGIFSQDSDEYVAILGCGGNVLRARKLL